MKLFLVGSKGPEEPEVGIKTASYVAGRIGIYGTNSAGIEQKVLCTLKVGVDGKVELQLHRLAQMDGVATDIDGYIRITRD